MIEMLHVRLTVANMNNSRDGKRSTVSIIVITKTKMCRWDILYMISIIFFDIRVLFFKWWARAFRFAHSQKGSPLIRENNNITIVVCGRR